MNAVRCIQPSDAAVLALLLAHSGPTAAQEPLPACRAADAPAVYDPILILPTTTLEQIEAYRAGWRRLCAREQEKTSLYELLVQATQIESAFGKFFPRENALWEGAKDKPEARLRRVEKLDRLLASKLPSFIPGFKGSLMDWEYFSPSLEYFREHQPLGDNEDHLFLTSEIPLRPGPGGSTGPWFKQIWDYGGCYRFGEFDWVTELERIAVLREKLHRELYRVGLAEYDNNLFEALTLRDGSCVCEDAASVVPDLETVSRFLAERGDREESGRAIDSALTRIRGEAISLRSLRDGTCGGH